MSISSSMDAFSPTLRGPAVFVALFLCVTLCTVYSPLISCIVAYVGKSVVALSLGAFISIVFNSYLEKLFGSAKGKTVDPQGRAVFVTGCDTGFGQELAHRLHKLGFYVFAGCLSESSPGAETLRAKGKAEDRIEVVECDVTKNQQVIDCAAKIKEQLRAKKLELFALVNNAGIVSYCEFEWVPVEDYEKLMDVNTLGTVRVMKAFLPLLRESAGRIVIVASLSGRYAIPGMVGYSMTKHAQIALADGLRRELKKFGIKVSLVEPGAYKTTMNDAAVGLSAVDKHWQNSSEEMRTFYGEAYYAAFKKHLEKVSASSCARLSEPVDCMEDAVISEHPKLRYVPGSTGARLRGFILPFLPYCVQDYLMKMAAAPAVPLCRNA
ncbi:retinol dehydrogenase 16-like [Paramacrobiotus metropolitanus]|uniref:retinol dehydrogenase 16-like n=1 Tax=Paramacrobiotus metropolitanus TaxID=2943436 RepID=UPI002445F3B7|nr:retinol dehydrogenase 16-like [Paramacrobiotus metropolitanus]